MTVVFFFLINRGVVDRLYLSSLLTEMFLAGSYSETCVFKQTVVGLYILW